MREVHPILTILKHFAHLAAAIAAVLVPTDAAHAVTFRFHAPMAETVAVAGTFNGWDPENLPLARDSAGVWTRELELERGKHQYKFVVDGREWMSDPANPNFNESDHFNSVLVVSSSGIAPVLERRPASAATRPFFMTGSDVSFVDEIEERGGVFRDERGTADAISILRRNGVNTVRLRLWNSPTDEYCGLGRTLRMARRAKALGMRWILDFHYSDYWADPGKQTKPAAWADLSPEELARTIENYTDHVLQRCAEEDVLPDVVQIGNEISNGFLWPDGRVGEGHDGEKNWNAFAALLRPAIAAARKHGCAVALHTDRSASPQVCMNFFDRLMKCGVTFDMIALSYYPWWHGSLKEFRLTMDALAVRYQKPVFLAEVAYPWTLEGADDERNLVGESARLDFFPATPVGQRDFLESVDAQCRAVFGDFGAGLIYWEAAVVPAKGFRSAWENMGVFDFKGNALPAIHVFH